MYDVSRGISHPKIDRLLTPTVNVQIDQQVVTIL